MFKKIAKILIVSVLCLSSSAYAQDKEKYQLQKIAAFKRPGTTMCGEFFVTKGEFITFVGEKMNEKGETIPEDFSPKTITQKVIRFVIPDENKLFPVVATKELKDGTVTDAVISISSKDLIVSQCLLTKSLPTKMAKK